MDRYFQIARCFRDEDLRGDRQPEFSQLDLEMSFVAEADVMAFVEAMAIAVSRRGGPERPHSGQRPFPRFTYREALDRYGSDKPDCASAWSCTTWGSWPARLRVPRLRRRRRRGRARRSAWPRRAWPGSPARSSTS